MKPRSIVFDLFGDYVRYHGAEIRLRGLSALLSCFGVPESTVRVVMARLRREGWFDTRREGRETIYELNERSWQLLDEGRTRIFNRVRQPWDGQWHMVIYSVPEAERALRDRVRKRLAWLGFGPLAASTWICPHDRLADARAALAEDAPVRLDLLRASSGSLDEDREMATRCWDLAGLRRDYHALLRTYRPRVEQYRAVRPEGADALVERMRFTYDYRKFPFRDPDLPDQLLPDGWPGHEAHELFLEAHELLREPAERYFRETAYEATPVVG